MKRLHLWLIVFLLIGVSEVESQDPDTFVWEHLEGHIDVNSVAFSPDGLMLASGSWSDNTVMLWDVDTRNHIVTLEGHTGGIQSVEFSPDGLVLASGATDKTIILWDVATRQRIDTLQHESFVNSVSFSPDGSMLASAVWEGTVLWDMTTRERINTLEGHDSGVNAASFSPDGTMLASGAWDSTVILWNVGTWHHIDTLEGHTDGITSVAFSSDGTMLASGSTDNTVMLWDVATRGRIHTFKEHTEFVLSVAFSPNGLMLVSGAWDSPAILWNVTTQQRIIGLEVTQVARSVAFSNDGSIVAAGTSLGVELWDISGQEQPLEQKTIDVNSNDNDNDNNVDVPTLLNSGLAIISGDNQEGTPNESLPHPFVVLAYNADGTVLSGLSVTFTVVSGDGTVNPTTVITDEEGIAKSTLTLGTSLDPHIVNVSAPGIPIVIGFWAFPKNNSPLPQPEQETPVVEGDDEFLQTSLEAPGLSIISGDNQEGTPNEPLPHPFVVLAYNADGTVLSGLSVTFTVVSGDGTVNPTNVITDEEGIAKSTLTLGTSLDPHIVDVSAPGIPIVIGFWAFPKDNSPLPQIDADVNHDGVVNVVDLAIVALNYGRQNVIHAHGDVNGDGAVDVNDLLAVAAVIDGTAAPSARDRAVEVFTAEQVTGWLEQARLVGEDSIDYRRGVQFLEAVLALLTPKETALLPNFPNPFNPETWLPYQLAEAVDVQISIYNTAGALIRRLDMGHQSAGFYTEKGQAAYWNGRNEQGGTVASGVYFYQLRAGNYSQMRRMLVVK